MFQTGGSPRRLHTPHVSRSHDRSQQRIFTEIFEIAAALGIACDVQSRSQQHFDAARTALLPHGFRITESQLGIERRGEHDRTGKGRRALQLADHRGVGQVVAQMNPLRGVGEIEIGNPLLRNAVEEKRGIAARKIDLFVEAEPGDQGIGLPIGLIPRDELLSEESSGGTTGRQGQHDFSYHKYQSIFKKGGGGKYSGPLSRFCPFFISSRRYRR